jgi:hypothetical protein
VRRRLALVALVAVAALTGCAGPTQEQVTAHLRPWQPTSTVIGTGTKGFLVQFKGVQVLPDSWPCGDNLQDTCTWLPKVEMRRARATSVR